MGVTMLIVYENDPDGPKARRARKWFSKNGPPDLQPLPLGYDEREHLKLTKKQLAEHILAWFARSLDNRDYNVHEHPSFYDYACGVMTSEFAPAFITKDEGLRTRFPPKKLEGLGPGLQWLPPKEYWLSQLPPEQWRKERAKLRRQKRCGDSVNGLGGQVT